MTSWEPKLDAVLNLRPIPLQDLADAIKPHLSDCFVNVKVEVVDCPDLTKEPFHLAAKGLCGNVRIADVGGPGNLWPVLRKDKIFDVKGICEQCDLPSAFAIGPGAGPFRQVGVNSEMVCDCNFGSGERKVQTRIAKINKLTNSYEQQEIVSSEFALMANLLLSDGMPGKVLRIAAECRMGKENFANSIRQALEKAFPTETVSLGGVFLLKCGKAKVHIMPDFPAGEFKDLDDITDNWLRYFEMASPLVCLSVFHSRDQDLNLRLEHTHCFSSHGDAGHYHYDVTPEIVEYEGFFVPAQSIYRIDKC